MINYIFINIPFIWEDCFFADNCDLWKMCVDICHVGGFECIEKIESYTARVCSRFLSALAIISLVHHQDL